MRTASYRVSDLQRFTIPLGFVGENEHCQVIFLAEDVYQEYPNAAASLTVRPPYGEPYPAVVTRDGNNVLWTVKDSDLTRSGQGELQLSFTTGEVVAKTYVGKTKICRSIQPTGDVPDPIEDFLTEAGAALTAIPETIDAAFDAITAEAETLEAGESATASFDSETKVLTIGVPAGADGNPGQPGADGYSPTITVTDITGGHRLTITDKNGTRTVDVMDGEDGQPGQDGQDGDPGAPGFSPVITVTDITGGHRLTITTATGTQTMDVMDGSGGDPTTLIDDTAGAGVVNKTWSANKLNTETSALLIATNSRINDINSHFDLPVNIFNKETAILNKRFTTSGEITNDGGAFLTYIPISLGVYTTKVASGIYGSSGALKFHLFDKNKTLLETITGEYTDESNGIATVNVENGNAVYLGWSQYKDNIDTLMFCRGSVYPVEYIEYTDLFTMPNLVVDPRSIKDFIAPKNLFDISTAIRGKRFSPSTGQEVDESVAFCAYIPITAGGYYTTKVSIPIFSTGNAKKFHLYDSSKTLLATVTGEYIDQTNAIAKVFVDAETYPAVKYIGWSYELTEINTVMFIEGSEYPSVYIPYTDKIIILDLQVGINQIRDFNTLNPLQGKKLVCDGDSICAASSANGGIYRGYGWCGRIGEKNNMTWHNCGVGGGTIATGTNSSHNLSTYIDTIHALYPTLDYLILEGGTNDADQDVPAGNPKISDYNIGDSETAYDTSTFYGALNMLFYKATKYYPKNKIGFIIAQKMGDDGSGYAASTNKRRQYFDMCIEICIKWGIPYIDLWNMGQLVPRANVFYNRSMTSQQNWDNGYAYSDGQHLTNVGYDIITPKIEAWMRML